MKLIFYTSIFVFILTSGLVAQLPTYVPQNGLVGWWPFNGNANDESWNANHGTVNGATLTSDRFGNLNNAYSFDGIGNYIQVQTQSQIAQTSNYSWSFWFNSLTSDFNGTFIGSFTYFVKLGHDLPGLFYKDEQGNQTNSFYIQQHFNVLPASNNWHHLVVVKSGNTIELFLNGLSVGTTTTYGFANFSPNHLTKFGNQYADYYNGKLDDIGIWSRALNQQEITNLYNSCLNTVSMQPSSIAINIGSNTQFSVASTDTTASFQWQSDNGFGFQNINNVGQYTGAYTSTLNVSNVTPSNNNQLFRCILFSNSCTDTSQFAILNVCGDISLQPNSQIATPNQTIQFFSGFTESPAIFQWQTDFGFGFENLVNIGQYSGVTTDSLTVSNVSLSNHNQPFRCVITSGPCTKATQTATLTVNNNMDAENWSSAGLMVYPNPVQDQMVIKVAPSWIGSSYAIVDAAGRTLVHGQLGSAEETISLKMFSSGVYLVKVGDINQQYMMVIKE